MSASRIVPLRSTPAVSPFELSGFCTLLRSFADDDQEVLRENKRDPLSLVPELLLFVVEEMAEVDVEQLQMHMQKRLIV